MKSLKIILLASLWFISLQTGQSQKTGKWLEPGVIMDPFHALSQPDIDPEALHNFALNEVEPALKNVFPGTVSYLVQGIDGDRKSQYVWFTVFPSAAIRDEHLTDNGLELTPATGQLWEKAFTKISPEKLQQYFNGWDTSNKNEWEIIQMTASPIPVSELSGFEISLHYLKQMQKPAGQQLENQLTSKLQALATDNSRLFLLRSDRGTLQGSYAIMELHQPGKSHKKMIMDSDLNLDTALFSTYRIW